jgi:hypothetical protein
VAEQGREHFSRESATMGDDEGGSFWASRVERIRKSSRIRGGKARVQRGSKERVISECGGASRASVSTHSHATTSEYSGLLSIKYSFRTKVLG